MSGKAKRKSANWVNRQRRDQYVRQARQQGIRARSAFKLEQIDARYQLLNAQSTVVDVGAAPGSWSQYAVSRLQDENQLVAVDPIAMKPVPGVQFILGDFTSNAVQDAIVDHFQNRGISLVLSDMAPSLTGIRVTDQARCEALQNSLLAFCDRALSPGGALLTKVFAGESLNVLRKIMSEKFTRLDILKPDASRASSRELYLLGRQFRQQGG